MPIKFTVKTSYVINGKRYDNLEEMPPEIRAIYDKAAGAENGAPDNLSSQRLKSAYRQIWAFLLSGVASLALVLLFGGRLEGSPTFRADSNAGWLLAVPALLFAAAFYTSVKRWRCENCGAFLPTINYPKEGPRCENCGRRHILR